MSSSIQILAISGSLRRESYNTAALRAAQELATDRMRIDLVDISTIPFYDGDVQARGFPEAVITLAGRIRNADGILFGCPEYNFSISGVLKNTLDWLSRCEPQPFAGKPAAIIGASMSLLGTARAQYDLRKIGVALDLRFVNTPEVMIGKAQACFDSKGMLVDDKARDLIGKLITALAEMITTGR